jgi:hypothetical protein
MKTLSLILLALFFCSADCMAQTKKSSDSVVDLSCPPGSFYSAQFQSCLPGSPEQLPPQNPPPPQCPAGYVYNSQMQTCGKGGGDWNAPSSSSSQRCATGSYYDERLKKCIKNRY